MAADGSEHPAGNPPHPPGEDDTIVCRCEDLTLRDIREVIAQGAGTMDEVKRLTRCGMGPCQGKTCRQLLAAELSRALHTPLGNLVMPTFRPTTKPIKISLLLPDCEDRGTVPTGTPAAATSDEEISL